LKKKQYWVALVAIGLIAVIYSFGTTKFPTKSVVQGTTPQTTNIASLLNNARPQLPAPQRKIEETLQNDLAAAHTVTDSITATEALMRFWGNDLKNHDIASWYLFQKAKLENSEKSLTFAANFILENTIHGDGNVLSAGWKAGLAQELFTAALQRNPGNDSLTTGLGASYLFSGGSNTMEGVQMILQQLKKDSANAYAHKMLGFGNIRNGETAKAITRFERSLQINPADTSLLPVLAMLCREAKDTIRAEKWFRKTKEVLRDNPEFLNSFEQQYNSLK
jgi:tetratricopeptide (TPR) repeat protein